MKWNRHGDKSRCDHASSVTGSATGVTRATCQACGHVSFRFHSRSVDPVRRDAFTREADSLPRQGTQLDLASMPTGAPRHRPQ